MSMASPVLERNLSVDAIVRAKTNLATLTVHIAGLLHARLPFISLEDCSWLASTAATWVAGIWPAVDSSTRSELAKDDVGVDQSTGLDVFVRVLQSLVQSSAVILGEPIAGIQSQEFDLGSFGQIGRLVDDKTTSLHSRLQRHATTVASETRSNKRAR